MASTKYRLCKRLNKCAHTRAHTLRVCVRVCMYCDSWQAHLHKIHIELGFLIANIEDDDEEDGAEKYASLFALGTCLSFTLPLSHSLRVCVSVYFSI